MDHGNIVPHIRIHIPGQGIRKGIIFLAEYFFSALFHDFDLIGVRLFPVKGADTFDNMV